ncbi:MAG: NADH-quinone oxidoreductase subunit NuoE [Bacteroidetes bacterium]|nr:MAG: NADH-quinone oxidoreductase subunit NuoE [Bacteroidota bacterium]
MRIKRTNISKTKIEEKALIDLTLIDPLISKYKNKKGNLIPLLQGVQTTYGYLPREAFLKLSDEVGLKLNDMYGVATFYAQFRLHPVGKHIIKVCHGTACHVQNSDGITDALKEELKINDGETTKDNLFTLESVACLGCCSLAPVMMIDGETYGKLDNTKAVKIIREINAKKE